MDSIKLFFRLVFQIVLSVPFALASVIALIPFFAALREQIGDRAETYSYGAAAFVAIIIIIAPTIRRCLGRGFILLAVCLFLLPVSTTFLSVEVSSQQIAEADQTDDLEVAAAYIGTGIVTTASALVTGFFGFFLGAVSLIIGLVLSLGGRREVVIVDDRRVKVSDGSAYEKRDRPLPDAPRRMSGGRIEPTISAPLRDKLKGDNE